MLVVKLFWGKVSAELAMSLTKAVHVVSELNYVVHCITANGEARWTMEYYNVD